MREDIVGLLSVRDEQVAERIGRMVWRLERGSPLVAVAVRAHHRAMPIPVSLAACARHWDVHRSTVLRWARDGEAWVESTVVV